MYQATRSFVARYDGEDLQITAGRDRVSDDCALVEDYPDAFERIDGPRSEIRATDPEGRTHALYTADDLKASDAAFEQRVRELARNPANREAGASFHEPSQGQSRPDGPPQVHEARDAGLRTIEHYNDSGHLRSDAADTLDRLVRDRRDPLAQTARYLDAVGDAEYNSAFGKILQYGAMAPLRFTPGETAAVQKVNAVDAERGLITGTGSAGGFALPIVIDPSIMLTSSGALNPIRQLARVITTNTTEWRGVTSAGVVASYDA
jgi:hypothetical protein